MIIIVRSPYLYRLKKENDKSKHIKLVNNIIIVDQKNQCQS